MLLSCEDNGLKDRALARPSQRVGRCCRLPCTQERALSEILEGELRLQREIESLKRSLKLGCDYNSSLAYNTIDIHRDNKIDHYNLKVFLNKRCAYPTDGEVTAIIRRIDIDGDQVLSFSEWDQFLGAPVV